VRQSRFLTTGDVQEAEDETIWWTPYWVTPGAQKGSPNQKALTGKEDTLREIDDSFYKLNADQSGFYRTNYPPERLMKLGQKRDRLSVPDKIGLMGDATALAVAGHATTASLLTLLENFKDEEEYL
jgi:aminopeptidase N